MSSRRVSYKNKPKRRKQIKSATKTSKSKKFIVDFFFVIFIVINGRTGFVIDPQTRLYHYWLGVISLAVVYNLLLIPARYSFDALDRNYRILWFVLDYTSDLVYLIDIFVRSRTGE